MTETDKLDNHAHAVIYCRVSTKDQDCSRQLADCRRFAERAGYIVGLELIETASGARNDRKERAKVLLLAKQRLIDVVLVTELSRWGRSTTDLIQTVETLYSYDVSLETSNDAMCFNPSSPQGKLFLSVISSFAEFERSLIRERIISGLASAKARGKHLGRVKGSGTTIKKNTKRVLELREAKLSIREIAASLNIGTQTVQSILKTSACSTIDDLIY